MCTDGSPGLTELRAFVEPYTPEWAEEETGIPAARDRRAGARGEQGQDPGHFSLRVPRRQPRERDLLPPLPDYLERPHGQHRKQGRTHHQEGPQGRRFRKLWETGGPERSSQTEDGDDSTEWAVRKLPIADPAHGVASMLPLAILQEDPYPVKALIIHRFDPMLSIPNYNQNKKAFDKLDFLLTIDINFSETAWYSDVVLPESMYLERSDSIQMANGPKPTLYMTPAVRAAQVRHQALLGNNPGTGQTAGPGTFLSIMKRSKTSGTFSSRTWESRSRISRPKGFVGLSKNPDPLGPKGGPQVQNPVRQNRIRLQPDGEKRLSLVSSKYESVAASGRR